MHPIKFSYTPADDDTDGLANDVAWAAGGYALAATTPADSLAHLITILGNAATDHSAKTFTVTGTDADGIAQSEDLAGPNGVATVTTTKYFKTVTAVTVSATTGADTFDIGWTDDIVSPTVPLNWRQQDVGVSLGVDVTGTIDYTVQHTFNQLHPAVHNTADPVPATFKWWPHSSIVAKTADTDGNYAFPVTATRLLINSLTAGATIAFYIAQGN